MKNVEVKRVLQAALKSEYGFQPTLNDITIYRTDCREGKPIYAYFGVNGKDYRFKSYISHIGEETLIWIGTGTIEKQEYAK